MPLHASRDWHRYLLTFSLILLAAIATVGYLFTGDAGNIRIIRQNNNSSHD
ncbi:MAG: hypothetical protein VB962_04480 [Pseudohongiellaceae bacterium]